MAEFKEVMKQAKRMCNAYPVGCYECPLSTVKGNCMLYETPDHMQPDATAKIEQTVTDWAKEHPEPRYPSWEEAWNKLFPGAVGGVPCPKYFISEKQYDEMCIGNDCERCLESPLSADIAEKLGVKPIGGEE